ncbi:calcium-dependent lipid-binding (CaLB domain) family protein [Actinidia rufa]|uniref:Calcium-dependent lipid-binding (CaLB domain) family protein n=1 Tax=Actinidia rufa TaxID=165716 RepID=A0A7J0E8M4_9ERIC|nr:calcium-dependent lipid-binding (CaLB domain) family protein [Actinidia rufa]
MVKIWVEVCLISARGLRRTSSLFKLQWYAVAWIEPNNKYCSRIAASGNANPVWKTKFSALVDNSEPKFQDLALHIEVYSREPLFLREKLQGTATVVLKEFLDKHVTNSEVSKSVEEVGSFQLRKRKSSKPQGFVDISIRISEEREEPSSYSGNDEGFKLTDRNIGINLANEYGTSQANPPQFPPPPLGRPENHLPTTSAYTHPVPLPTAYSNSSQGAPSYPPGGGPSYQPPRTTTPPPPPPPSNVGYIPTFLPRTDLSQPTYFNMPPSGRGGGAGFGMGLGAGALAAGAVIFGDDFMSGFDVPTGLQGASLTVTTDPPF